MSQTDPRPGPAMLRTLSRSLAPLALALLAACSEDTGSLSGTAPSTLVNLGLATTAEEIAGEEDLWLFAVREFATDARDLDGDGDALDLVVYAQDLVSGTARNTALALDVAQVSPLRVDGDLGAFAVSERGTGGRDRNGDGDADDAVLHVHDRTTGVTRNLGLAVPQDLVSEFAVGDGLVAFAVGERDQGGADLDGDGVADDRVLHVYDAAANRLVNTGLAAPSRVFLGGGRVAWFDDESAGDRNGDGDRLDLSVLQILDPVSGASRNTGLATAGTAPLAAADAWLVLVPEAAQGIDLDGDGDLFDVVPQRFDAATGEVQNLGLAVLDPRDVTASTRPAGQEAFAFLAAEDTGDANDDGDTFDRFPIVLDARTGVARAPTLAAVKAVFVGRLLCFLVPEAGDGRDQDGDGDLDDLVVFTLDGVTGELVNLGLDALDISASDELLLIARPEAGVGIDWNLDGDLDDVVVHDFDPFTRTAQNTGIAAAAALGATRAEILLLASEAGEGLDLNADGDALDQVFLLFDRARRQGASLNLAGGEDAARFGSLTSSGRLVLLADENAQGLDLDQDGDLFDLVLHRGE